MTIGIVLTALAAGTVVLADNGSALQLMALISVPLLAWVTWAAYRVKQRRINGRTTRKV